MPDESAQGKHRTPLKYEFEKHRFTTAPTTITITIAVTTTITGTVILTVATTARYNNLRTIYYSIAQGV